MPTTSGGVDEYGHFFFIEEYSTKSAIDMERLRALLYDPEVDWKVDSYDDEHVVVKVRPSWGGVGDGDW